jgi:hypothetical protein
MARKRPTKAQLRQRYAAAGWVGLGLLAGLALGIGLWVLDPGGSTQGERAAGAAKPSPASPPAPDQAQSPPSANAPAPRGDPEPAPEVTGRGPRAAIIIDDLGNNWREARAVNSLPYPVAVAVLPGTPYAARTARRAHERGKEVLAHMPMEPEDGSIRLGTTFLRTGMGRERLVATLRSNLETIPHVQGINNHMGSRLTARTRPMRWVMEALGERGLYFVDSRTTAATQALRTARATGIPAAERDVFLDHEPKEAAIRAQFRNLLAEARAQGTAIGIGHPYPATLKVLRELLPEASRHGVEIVPLKEVLAVRNRWALRDGTLAFHGSHKRNGGAP